MKSDIKNIEASVKSRLQNKAKETDRRFADILRFYGMERFLYRFSESKYAKLFILKGALMFTVWEVPERRTTVDIDFLARFDNQIEKIEQVIREVCHTKVPPDGLVFDAETVEGRRIKEDADYEGVRVKFMGFLERSKILMQIDFGFGDVVTPKPTKIDYPTILDFPAPHLQGYTFESVVAEKFEAMVKLGVLNSRMKDFYDIWLLARQFDFQGERLIEAIKKTFDHRGTQLPIELPFFAQEIYNEDSDRQTLWSAFLKKGELKHAPKKLREVAKSIEEFLLKLVEAIHEGKDFNKEWKAAGSWK